MISVVLSVFTAALAAYVALLAALFGRAHTLRDQGWFAGVAITAGLFTLCNLATTGAATAPEVVVWFARCQLLIGGLHVAGWLFYTTAYLGVPSRLDRPAALVLGTLGLAAFLPAVGFTGTVTDHAFAPLGIVYHDAETGPLGDAALAAILSGLLVVLARFARAWRRGVPHAGLHALALGFLVAMALNDALVLAGVYRAPYLLDLGFIVPVGAVAYALGARVVDDARALEWLRRGLEAQVQARTGELARSEAARLRAEKLAALGQLAAGVAHEVNNPSAILAANLRYLRESLADGDGPPDDVGECLRESEQATDRIARMVRQLLDASRLAASADRPGVPVSLRAAATEAVQLARLRTGAAAVTVDVPPDLAALGHEHVIVQVLVNLVVNGAQAIPAGRPGRVTIRGARAGDRARLLVEDDGAGMTPDVLRRIFEPFFSTKEFGGGSGLGLAVSRGLVASLGGDLRLESAPGSGTRAVVELPLADARAPEPAGPTEPETPRGPRRSLLLVDDEPAVRTSLRRVLEERYAVTLASHVDEGVALARTGRFDVVLCDVMMPDGGAERLAAALDRDAPALARRVVFLTGGATTPAARAFLAAETRPVLSKPLDLAELARVAEKISGSGASGGAPEDASLPAAGPAGEAPR